MDCSFEQNEPAAARNVHGLGVMLLPTLGEHSIGIASFEPGLLLESCAPLSWNQCPSNAIRVRTGTSSLRSFSAPPRSGKSMMKQAAST